MGAVGVAGGWELGEDEEGRVFIRLGIVLGVLVASLVGLQVLYTSSLGDVCDSSLRKTQLALEQWGLSSTAPITHGFFPANVQLALRIAGPTSRISTSLGRRQNFPSAVGKHDSLLCAISIWDLATHGFLTALFKVGLAAGFCGPGFPFGEHEAPSM